MAIETAEVVVGGERYKKVVGAAEEEKVAMPGESANRTSSAETAKTVSLATPVAAKPDTSVGDVARSLSESLPEVNTTAAKIQEEATVLQNNTPESPIPSLFGETFNAEIHRVGSDGKPMITAKGRFERKRGRKPDTGSYIPGSEGAKVPEVLDDKKYEMVGKMLGGMLTSTAQGLLGSDFIPRKPPEFPLDEQDMLNNAFAEYARAKNWADLPPSITLILAISMYALPRLSMPNTQARLKAIKESFTRRRERKQPMIDKQLDEAAQGEHLIDEHELSALGD